MFPQTVAAEDDPVRAGLIEQELQVENHYLSAPPSSDSYLGPHFRIRDCEVIYRLTDEQDLLLVLYRRLQQAKSLRNPFADLIWFLQFATEPQFGLRRVLGHISTLSYRHENGLSEERLVRFYQRFFQADWIVYDGNDWLCQNVSKLRTRLAKVRHLATRW